VVLINIWAFSCIYMGHFVPALNGPCSCPPMGRDLGPNPARYNGPCRPDTKLFRVVPCFFSCFGPAHQTRPKCTPIAGHGDFCALVASRGIAVAFLKSGCTHGKIVNRPNFSLSPADLIDIPSLARSIGNRFIKLVWTKGGRSLAGDEARSHLKPVTKSYLVLTFSFKFEFSLQYFNMYRMTKLKSTKPKLSRRSEAQ
jgi:hypothetical protein